MTTKRTGPELFARALSVRDMTEAQVAAINANTAALVMLAGLYANNHSMRSRELEVWADVLPSPPMVECWGKEARRPACAERHTEDCPYADPPPEPKHELLPIGTRVLVSETATKYKDGRIEYARQPYAAKIVGYTAGNSKYKLNHEKFGGGYYDFAMYAFADNRVQVHPEQDTAVAEPTGPRVYVQNHHGKQGHVVEFRNEKDKLCVLVQWHAPGTEPVWRSLGTLTIIAPEEVERCENGQTRQECTTSDLCELCQQDDDAEGDEIEESMGLR
jgi:hypothetical protein